MKFMCIFTGIRPNEWLQLLLIDIEKDFGSWVLNVMRN